MTDREGPLSRVSLVFKLLEKYSKSKWRSYKCYQNIIYTLKYNFKQYDEMKLSLTRPFLKFWSQKYLKLHHVSRSGVHARARQTWKCGVVSSIFATKISKMDVCDSFSFHHTV